MLMVTLLGLNKARICCHISSAPSDLRLYKDYDRMRVTLLNPGVGL